MVHAWYDYNIHIARFIQMSIGTALRMQKYDFIFSFVKIKILKRKILSDAIKHFNRQQIQKHIIIFLNS